MRRWWQRRSLRLRLTVWYAATSTVILLALGGMVFFVVNRRLVAQLDGQLRGDFELVESRVIRDAAGQLHWQGYGEDSDENEAGQQIDPWIEILSPVGSTVSFASRQNGRTRHANHRRLAWRSPSCG